MAVFRGDSTLTRWLLVAGGVLSFVLLTAWTGGGGPTVLDGPIVEGLAGARSDGLTEVVLAVTQLGGGWTVVALTMMGALALLFSSRRSAVFLVGSMLGVGLLSPLLKEIVGRPRPQLGTPVYDAAGFSFPSGHSLASIVLFGALVLIARTLRPRLAWPAATAAAILVASVGLTRIYLGVHYPTDVLAGWALGLAWLLTLYSWYRRDPAATPRTPA